MSKLTDKQSAFCLEYMVDLNATQAAIRANYSKKTAGSVGHENLQKPEIQARLAVLIDERSKRVQVDADWVLKQMKDIHELDVIDILDNTGNFKKVTDWTKPWRMYISGMDIQEMLSGDTESITRKIKWPDKVKNLEMIGRHVNVNAWKEADGAPSEQESIKDIRITVVNGND